MTDLHILFISGISSGNFSDVPRSRNWFHLVFSPSISEKKEGLSKTETRCYAIVVGEESFFQITNGRCAFVARTSELQFIPHKALAVKHPTYLSASTFFSVSLSLISRFRNSNINSINSECGIQNLN